MRQFMEVTPGWFESQGTTLLAGRGFIESDLAETEPVMIVNDAFARQVLGTSHAAEAVDVTLAVTSRFPPLGDIPLGAKRIVGVVGDAVYRSLRDARRPTTYLPLGQRRGPLMYDSFFVAVAPHAGSAVQLTETIGAAMRAVNQDISVRYRYVADQVSDVLAQDRVLALLASFFGALAVTLAGLGLYGVTAYTVGRRRPEIALRLALGATPDIVVRQVLMRLGGAIGLGIVVGTVVSAWASTFVAAQLFGVEPTDTLTFAAAVALVVAVCRGAGWVPAQRASQLDPAMVLRDIYDRR